MKSCIYRLVINDSNNEYLLVNSNFLTLEFHFDDFNFFKSEQAEEKSNRFDNYY